KPSPSRAGLLGVQRAANALIREEAGRLQVAYIDVFTPMLDAAGRPREDLFVADRLHMNAAGYALWRRTIAPYLAE
ncbi:MAG: GDSL-type esterase/lipase family protein, partial [Pseudoxanthomonas sp.]